MNTIVIIVIVLVICIVAFFFMKRYVSGLIGSMEKRSINLNIQNDKTKGMIRSLRVVESDDRILRLLRDPNTNMTELGWALEKGNVIMTEMDQRHIGTYRDFIYKFKTLSEDLITETKNIDIDVLVVDTEVNKATIDKLILHWQYYQKIYDRIFTNICKNAPHIHSGPLKECYDLYKAFFKDQPLEDIRWESQDIIKNLQYASEERGQRRLYLERAIKEITDLSL